MLYQSYMNDVNFSILLYLTPVDLTCQFERPWLGTSYLVVKTIFLMLHQSYMNNVDFSILLCLTLDDFTSNVLGWERSLSVSILYERC